MWLNNKGSTGKCQYCSLSFKKFSTRKSLCCDR
ncbi:hypothetical protein HPB58_17230 [Priestia filamentosa]|nr:hypothetical protein HPB58_17230 [Priestia filamentosa]